MMPDGVTYANIGDLKQQYMKGGPHDQLQEEAYIWDDYLAVGEERLQGQGLYTAIRVGGNIAIQAQLENEALPPPQHQRNVQPKVLPKFYSGTVQFSNQSRKMAGNSRAAFIDRVDYEVTQLKATLRKRLNIDFWRDGKTKHATVTAATIGATQPVNSPWTIFEYGVYDHYDSTLTTRKNADLIAQSKSVGNANVVFDRSITTALNDVFVPRGELTNAPSDGKGLTGITAIIDTTTVATEYLTVSRATYPSWQGNVIPFGGVAVSEDALQKMEDRVYFVSGKRVTDVWSNPLQRRKYLSLVTPQKRFASLRLDAGWDELEWNGKRWMVDVDCPNDEVVMCGEKPKMYYTPEGELQLADIGGSSFTQRDGYPSSWGYMEMYGNLACTQPNANIRGTGFSTPSA